MALGEQRIALVTGADCDVGASSARWLAADGAQVIVCGHEHTALRNLADELDATICVVDTSDRQALSSQLNEIALQLGSIDVLVVCPERRTPAQSLWEAPRQWQGEVGASLTGAFNLVQAIAPTMRDQGWGRIVFAIPAPDAHELPRIATYLATVEGLIALTKTLGRELSSGGVLTNAVVPRLDWGGSPTEWAGLPEMIAPSVAFLASARSGAYAGQIFRPSLSNALVAGGPKVAQQSH